MGDFQGGTLRLTNKNRGANALSAFGHNNLLWSDPTGLWSDPAGHWPGIWYLAGANTCVYSNPPEELGATRHVVQTSNRRFRDDEFLVPRDLTEDRTRIRVRIRFTPVDTPLFPGHPVPELAWSEIRYTVYCGVLP